MPEEFKILKNEIQSLKMRKNLVSVLLYGSVFSNRENADDLDGIVVVKNVDSSIVELFNLLNSKYAKLDFNIYSYDEVVNDVSFYTREFKLEYLAKGLCIYGKNLFKEEFKKVSKYKYRQSILIRTIEHVQSVRQKYLSSSLSDDQKRRYMEKYFLRISRNILLFKGLGNHTSVNLLNESQLMQKLVDLEIYSKIPKIDPEITLEELFNNFKFINVAILKCREEFEGKKSFAVNFMRRLYNTR